MFGTESPSSHEYSWLSYLVVGRPPFYFTDLPPPSAHSSCCSRFGGISNALWSLGCPCQSGPRVATPRGGPGSAGGVAEHASRTPDRTAVTGQIMFVAPPGSAGPAPRACPWARLGTARPSCCSA